MVLAGLLLRLKDAREGILVEGIGCTAQGASFGMSQQTRSPSRRSPPHRAPRSGCRVTSSRSARWAAQNARLRNTEDEARYTRLGLVIKAATAPDFRIAVAAAGATPYFSQRPTEDLLGKNDAYIAHLAPRGVFSPGHDKWDYSYSLGRKNAQLIVEPVDVNDADEAYMTSLGFKTLENGMRLKDGAPVKDDGLLGLDQSDNSNINTALGFTSTRDAPDPFNLRDIGILLCVFGLIAPARSRSGLRRTKTRMRALRRSAKGQVCPGPIGRARPIAESKRSPARTRVRFRRSTACAASPCSRS